MKRPMKRPIFTAVMTTACLFCSAAVVSAQTSRPSKFYDFHEQVIDGEIRVPAASPLTGKKRVQFDRLLRLKKSFLPRILDTSRDQAFK